jgi:hypothetical protein
VALPDDPVPGPAMPLAAFIATLRPHITGTSTLPSRRPGGQPHVIRSYSQGHDDQIWHKVLQMGHRIERHTAEEWHALIAEYKAMPAHPHDPNYRR